MGAGIGTRLIAAAGAAAVALLVGARPAEAVPVTIEFSGSVDFSAVGGPAVNTYSGFVTWDSDALPFETGDETTYDVLSYQLIFNGTDVTLPIVGEGFGNGIGVLDDSDLVSPGTPVDGLLFFASLRSPFPISGSEGDLIFVATMLGPTSMFGTTALPANLDFLQSLTTTATLWAFEPDEGSSDALLDDVVGSLDITAPVPEPTLLVLTGLGLAGTLARGRRARSRS